jgi:hypothetical protein
MDSLAAYEYGLSLPRDQLLIIPLRIPVLPLKIDHRDGLWNSPANRSFVLMVDEDIVLKLQTQFEASSLELPSESRLLEMSIWNFISQELESAVFKALQDSPAPHLVRWIHEPESGIAFFERLTQLRLCVEPVPGRKMPTKPTEPIKRFTILGHRGFCFQITS